MVHLVESGALVDTVGLCKGQEMWYSPGICTCGTIKDGIAFDIGRGGWVISFEDFTAMYEMAVEVRKQEAKGGVA